MIQPSVVIAPPQCTGEWLPCVGKDGETGWGLLLVTEQGKAWQLSEWINVPGWGGPH